MLKVLHASLTRHPPRPHGPGIRFTETMTGAVRWCGGAESFGASPSVPLSFKLTFFSGDLHAFAASPEHQGLAVGALDFPALGGSLPIRDGRIRLFVPDAARAGHQQMVYQLPFNGSDGRAYVLVGQKDIHDDRGLDAWKDTTTLSTRIYRGDSLAVGTLIAEGELRLNGLDLIRQLATFRAVDAVGKEQTVSALAQFFTFFGVKVAEEYGNPFRVHRSKHSGTR